MYHFPVLATQATPSRFYCVDVTCQFPIPILCRILRKAIAKFSTIGQALIQTCTTPKIVCYHVRQSNFDTFKQIAHTPLPCQFYDLLFLLCIRHEQSVLIGNLTLKYVTQTSKFYFTPHKSCWKDHASKRLVIRF